jgi:hypothetical protein
MRDSAFVSWNVRTMPARATLMPRCCRACARRTTTWQPRRTRAPEELLRRRRLVEAGDQVEERRFAGAVRTDQRGDRAALHLEVAHVDGCHPAEAALDVVDHEDGIGLGRAGVSATFSSVERMACVIAPGSCETGTARSAVWSGIEAQLLLIAEDALWSEDHQQGDTDQHPRQPLRLLRVEDRGRMYSPAICTMAMRTTKKMIEPSRGPKIVAAPPSSMIVHRLNVSGRPKPSG